MIETTSLDAVAVTVAPTFAVRTTRKCGPRPDEISRAMTNAFDVLAQYAARHHLEFTAPPRGIYTAWGPEGAEFTVAMPVVPPDVSPQSEKGVDVGEIAGCSALRFTHRGPYQELQQTYGQIGGWMKANGLMKTDADWASYTPMWEEYVTDPASVPASELLTYIYLTKP
jgi:DNA gyrase inhibitor GyrI